MRNETQHLQLVVHNAALVRTPPTGYAVGLEVGPEEEITWEDVDGWSLDDFDLYCG